MIRELLILHHSHVDIGYTHPQRVAWEIHNRCIDEAIGLCERNAELKWTCEVTCVVEHWLATASRSQISRVRKLIERGQFGFGAMWANWTALQQEDMLVESLQPMRRLREDFGVDFQVAIQADVNGIPWPTADLLLDAGIGNLMMNVNIHMGGFPLSRPLVFRWRAPSGREILVFSGEHYNAFTRESGIREPDISVAKMADKLAHYFQRLSNKGWTHDFAVLTATHPFMDDNGPPNPELPDIVRRWNESGRAPIMRFVTPNELFGRIRELDMNRISVHGGDWTDFWTNGVAASALDVALSRRAHGALWTARALATRLPARATALHPEAVRLMHLANEHTWNIFASTGALGCGGSGRIEPMPEAEQRTWKSAKCADALTSARMARRDALDLLARNPAQSRTQESILVFNPSELARKVCLRLPNELIDGEYPLVAGTKHRFDVIEDILADTAATTWVGPVEIPPLTGMTLPLIELNKTATGDVHHGDGYVESKFWRLEFDNKTGSIKSLITRQNGNEYFDSAAGWDLFGPVQETVAKPSAAARKLNDPRYDFFAASEANFDDVIHSDAGAWVRDWQARHTRPQCNAKVRTEVDGDGVRLIRTFLMAGVNGEMIQTISLSAHEPRVRFEAFFNKADITEPESLYFTFPFAMHKAQIHFDTAGCDVAYDKEQLPGACRDWFTAGSYVAVAGRGGCLTLACPDAPLFQVGGFHYGRGVKNSRGLNHALLLAWPMNNYWNTNFRASQPGLIRFRYELSWAEKFSAAACARFAASVARPVVFHPVAASSARDNFTLLASPGDDITVSLLKPSADGNAIIAGLHNHSAEPLTIPSKMLGRQTIMTRLTSLQEPAIARLSKTNRTIPARSTALFRIEGPRPPISV